MPARNTTGHKKLFRSRDNKVIAGVCGGFGAYIGLDPTIIRFAWIILTALTGFVPGIVAYAAVAFIVPRQPATA
jgi:phage shock protein C